MVSLRDGAVNIYIYLPVVMLPGGTLKTIPYLVSAGQVPEGPWVYLFICVHFYFSMFIQYINMIY